jgi:CheY-like chemotaxis protein
LETNQAATPFKPRILLVTDPAEGTVLGLELISKGYDVFRARGTLEARWLWVANFYDLVLLTLPSDGSNVTSLVQRIRAQAPQQQVAFWDQWDGKVESSPRFKRLVTSVSAMPLSISSSTKKSNPGRRHGLATIIEMPKRSR